MKNDPYAKFIDSELILRDYLAADRTVLANERTLLAYIRTALTLFVAGVSFVHFFDSLLIELVGWVFIPVGIAMLVIGLVRYRKMKGSIGKIKQRTPSVDEAE